MARGLETTGWFELTLSVINPLLVMGAIGSLAFFLIDVGYAGKFDDRLRWTFFFFVFGAVLTSRIALLFGSERGSVYGFILGLVAFVATLRFAHGAGWLLNLAIFGVIATAAYLLTRDSTFIDVSDTDAGGGLLGDWNNTATKSAKRRGRWVVIFILAAWVVFGLGQSLIPAADSARRQSALTLMFINVACGLGLLLTTALLSLRLYLRGRRLNMPLMVTTRWLVWGLGIIAVGLLLALMVPRPNPEYAFLSFKPIDSVERSTSKRAMDSKGGGEGEGRAGGEKGKSDNKTESSGKGENDQTAEGRTRDGKRGRDGKSESKDAESKEKGAGTSDSDANTEPPASPAIDSVVNVLQAVARWIIILVCVAVVAFFVLRNLAATQTWAARLMEKLAQWWRGLFGLKEGEESPEEQKAPPEAASFESYADPFANGTADRHSERELVRYTFDALDAWADHRGIARQTDETPLEFAARLGKQMPDLRQPVKGLANVYALLAYTHRPCPDNGREIARSVWEAMKGSAG